MDSWSDLDPTNDVADGMVGEGWFTVVRGWESCCAGFPRTNE